jgi:hypothetical protein
VDRHGASAGQRPLADGDVAHDRGAAVADHAASARQPLGELAVARIVLDRHHERPDHLPAHPQGSADRREHQRPAQVVEHAACAQDPQADDVLVVVDQQAHLAAHGREVAGGDRIRQQRIGLDRLHGPLDPVAGELADVDPVRHTESGREVGSVGGGTAGRRGGAAGRTDRQQRHDRHDRRGREKRRGDAGALRHRATP